MSTDASVGIVPTITTGHRIRIAREAAGMDQGQLADVTGISRSTISNYEKGATTHIKPLYVSLIASATGVDQGWLETGEAGSSPSGPGLRLLPQVDSNHQHFDYQSHYALAATG